jgi:hypothetical protein
MKKISGSRWFPCKTPILGFPINSPKDRELYKTIQENKFEIFSSCEPTHWLADVENLQNF